MLKIHHGQNGSHRQSIDLCKVKSDFSHVPLAMILNPDCIVELYRELFKMSGPYVRPIKSAACEWGPGEVTFSFKVSQVDLMQSRVINH